jgi:putative lipoprotein
LPADAPAAVAAAMIIEVRDVSMADAPSTVVAMRRLDRVTLAPGARIPFALDVPEVSKSKSLSVRVHIDVDGNGQVGQGDLLSTQAYPVSAAGPLRPVTVRVVKI